MSIFRHSRFVDTPVYISRGTTPIFDIRKRLNFNKAKGVYHTWGETDTTDTLAYKHYGTSALWWVILDANPEYNSEIEIQIGDLVFIPDRTEVPNIYA